MTVFKLFLKILRSRLVAILLYTVVFMILAILFSQVGQKQNPTSFTQTELSIAVIDRDESRLSASLTSYLGQLHTLKEVQDTKTAMLDALYNVKVNAILIIPEGFGDAFMTAAPLSIESVKTLEEINSTLLNSQANEYLQNMRLYMQSGLDIESAAQKTVELSDISVTSQFLDGTTDSSSKPGLFYFLQYLPYIFLNIMIVGLTPVFSITRRDDIHKRNVVSSLKLRKYNIQLSIVAVLYAVFIWALFMLASLLLYSSSWRALHSPAFLLNTFAFVLVGMSLSVMCGFIVKSENAIAGIANVLSLFMSFLGGIFVPLDMLGDTIKVAARFIPTYWYTTVNNLLFSGRTFTGADEQLLYTGIGIQLGFACAFLAIGLLINKLQRNQRK
ncbi:MAG: ABC transporter permease [Lachnospiraceae bacterium]